MSRDQYFVKSLHFSEESTALSSDIIGQKAVGLFSIPVELTPPFIVLKTNLFTKWLIQPNDTEHLLQDILNDCANLFGSKKIENFILRSSAPDESFEERGLYESSNGDIQYSNLFDSVLEIWRKNKNLSLANENGFAVIIQQYIKPKLLGHLSNERRISNHSKKWLFEIENSDEKNTIKEFTVYKEINGLPINQCKNQKLLKKALIEIASYWQTWKYNPIKRYHLEWVWDQNRLWIVQNDIEDNSNCGSVPGSDWITHLTDITQSHELTCFNTIHTTKSDWKKINCVKTFAHCSLPYGNIYILENDKLISDLASDDISQELIKDLEWLLQTPIVIRMDVEESDNVLLPRTETLFTIDSALAFLCRYSREFKAKGEYSKFCFLLHRFIISKSCALAFSKPSISKVRIDSTWGIVDGLHYYSHDSFEVDYRKSLQKKVRCKTEYIDVDSSGKWYPRNSGTEWDWRDSLTKDQIDEIARYNLAIASYLGKPVTVMYFVDVNPATGYTSIIPWFYSTEEVLDTSESHFKDNVFYPDNILIQDQKSFDLLKIKLRLEPKNRITIKLKLNVEAVRDKSLVEAIGIFAHDNNISIELEGSILAHTYYILKKQNAKVRTIDQFDYKNEKQIFNKLVRDKIPENITAKGEKVEVKSIPKDQKVLFLKSKAIEEAYELFWEKRNEKELEELADLFEVIRSICKELDITIEELSEIANIKSEQKGGFDKGLFLFQTENPSLFQERPLNRNLSLFEQTSGTNFSNPLKRRTDTYQGTFLIPYVPQVDVNSTKLTRFLYNQNIEILYTESGIRIKLLNHDKDPNQLNLFD